MKTDAAARVAKVAEDYYDSEDADNFYNLIWGGEDIHIGLYQDDVEPIAEASRRTVAHMADKIEGLGPDTRVLDIGAGYGGAARYMAKTYKAPVVCLNISEKENERNRMLSKEQGLDDLVSVKYGSFEEIPEPDASFDVVWSQDAILHSGNRVKVLQEVARVLKPGGQFIFTDPMQADVIEDHNVLKPIYERIHLDSLGSVAFYRKELEDLGFEVISLEPLVHQLRNHYSRVRRELEQQKDGALKGHVSPEYVDRMMKGLQHWVDGADNGVLNWGVLHFRKKS